MTGAQPVGVNSQGQLGVRPSSTRFKEEIKPMDKASEAILALQPVSFRYRKELDPKATPQFGLVAEDVAKVNPDLVMMDDQGKPFTVRYEEVNAMLLNEFLKEHRRVETQAAIITEMKLTATKQDAAIAELRSQLKALSARVDEQGRGITEVSLSRQLVADSPRIACDHCEPQP